MLKIQDTTFKESMPRPAFSQLGQEGGKNIRRKLLTPCFAPVPISLEGTWSYHQSNSPKVFRNRRNNKILSLQKENRENYNIPGIWKVSWNSNFHIQETLSSNGPFRCSDIHTEKERFSLKVSTQLACFAQMSVGPAFGPKNSYFFGPQSLLGGLFLLFFCMEDVCRILHLVSLCTFYFCKLYTV